VEYPTDKEKWLLTSTGFRQLRTGLWLRPDNLRRTGTLLVGWLHQLGLSHESIIGEQLMLQEKNYRLLVDDYCITKLEQQYLDLVSRLDRSTESLRKKPADLAMIESFTLGGEALHVLAKDPYLPAQLQEPRNRERLWQTILRYDELGRSIWSGAQGSMPTSITSYG
jgi:phenylacetic acid degradation operon negative regulatory protein